MIALLGLHDVVLSWDPEKENCAADMKKAKQWVASKTCPEWQNGYLTGDETCIPLFQKPGEYEKVYFDKKKNHSVNCQIHFLIILISKNLLTQTLQVICLPHNLRIVDYVVGVPGSVHDSSSFNKSKIIEDPQLFFPNGEWMWADSAYDCTEQCVPPFKKPCGNVLVQKLRWFNYFLSRVCLYQFLYDLY